MEAFGRIMLMLIGMAGLIWVNIMVMIHGWGIEPQSWWWIIGASVVGGVVSQMFIELAKQRKD